MKYLISLLIVFFGLLHSVMPQSSSPPLDSLDNARVRGGYLIGLQAFRPESATQLTRVTPHFGYFIDWRLGKRTRLYSDLMLKWTGKHDIRMAIVDSLVDQQGQVGYEFLDFYVPWLLYFEFPLMLQYQLPGERLRLMAGLRPSLVLPLDALDYSTSGGGSNGSSRQYSLKDAIRKYNLGLSAGVSYQLGQRLRLDLRYSYGLQDLSYNAFFRNNAVHRNSDLQITLRRYFLKPKTE